MTDPEAWKQTVSAVVGQQHQAHRDAATREQTRQEHLATAHQQACAFLRGHPLEGFQEFAAYLHAQGETAAVREEWDHADGPWIGVYLSDPRGVIMDVVLQARVGAGETRWFWVYEHGGNQRRSREQEIPRGDAELSKHDVIETLAAHFQTASAHRR